MTQHTDGPTITTDIAIRPKVNGTVFQKTLALAAQALRVGEKAAFN